MRSSAAVMEDEMKKVRIYRPAGGLKMEDELRRLLDEAGCEIEGEADADAQFDENEVEGAEDAEEIEAHDRVEDPPACIVVLTPGLEADPDLQAALDEAEREGCTIIGLWPSGSVGSVIPKAFEKGDDTVAWDPASLREALSSDTPLCQAPDGGTVQTPLRPHLKSCG